MIQCRVLFIWTAIMTIAAADVAFAQGYGGPSMLSRGGNRPGRRGRAPVDIAVYGALRGTAETGLTPVSLEDDGTIVKQNAFGVQAELGAYGTHSWKRSIMGLDYRGDYRRTTRTSAYNGLNQALSFDLQTELNRRTTLVFRETGGTTNRAFGGFAAPVISDLQSLSLANNEVFDSRSYFSQTTATVAHQRSARTTYIFSGDGFFVKRPDPRLVGMSGFRAAGGVDYRLNRRSSAGFGYSFLRFRFPRVSGGSDAHSLAATFTRSVTRNVDILVTGGVFRLEAFGTESITLSPEVAAVLGQTTGYEAFNRKSWIPQIQARANYTLERSRFSLAFVNGISPGNGVYLTSQTTSVSAGYSFTGTRKLSLGASSRYMNLKSQSISISNMQSTSVGGGLNYRLTDALNLSSQLDYRTFRSPGLSGREGFAFVLGFTVSPSRIPLSIW